MRCAIGHGNADVISDEASRIKVRIVKTNEDFMIARHVSSTLGWKRAQRRRISGPVGCRAT
jgi:acetate kinase